MKHGKNYVDSAKLIDKNKQYDTKEAIDLLFTDCKSKV